MSVRCVKAISCGPRSARRSVVERNESRLGEPVPSTIRRRGEDVLTARANVEQRATVSRIARRRNRALLLDEVRADAVVEQTFSALERVVIELVAALATLVMATAPASSRNACGDLRRAAHANLRTRNARTREERSGRMRAEVRTSNGRTMFTPLAFSPGCVRPTTERECREPAQSQRPLLRAALGDRWPNCSPCLASPCARAPSTHASRSRPALAGSCEVPLKPSLYRTRDRRYSNSDTRQQFSEDRSLTGGR